MREQNPSWEDADQQHFAVVGAVATNLQHLVEWASLKHMQARLEHVVEVAVAVANLDLAASRGENLDEKTIGGATINYHSRAT